MRLTARGAVTLLFVITLLGQLIAPGPVFIVGCAVAVLLVNPRDLLPLVVTPPLVFFLAALFIETVHALRTASFLQSLALGLFTTLSAAAPWLLAGSALTLGVAWRRGLAANLRVVRQAQLQRVPKPRQSRDAVPAFAPEPEGYFEPRVYGSAKED
ncbi:hypothetical protein Aph01nite_62200 [Acrocarpospora phusangensis]|uniref:DUF6542 domain-containing protein n=1 Tax=Acrocarpospora phusangensis TaxID=1070424 RepID=A0A919QKC6_9ACTN|nr:DUF6542 domain-containing protein [Acrocarpospora phusangensis]GIH27910.1 hypothetical protein Aph01nite_62200 [Acrocarpospora phusangensis]